jgi:hypothetical protein
MEVQIALLVCKERIGGLPVELRVPIPLSLGLWIDPELEGGLDLPPSPACGDSNLQKAAGLEQG